MVLGWPISYSRRRCASPIDKDGHQPKPSPNPNLNPAQTCNRTPDPDPDPDPNPEFHLGQGCPVIEICYDEVRGMLCPAMYAALGTRLMCKAPPVACRSSAAPA